MTAPALPVRTNPLARAAAAIPTPVAAAVLVGATLAAIAFAFLYAYDQDTLFPDRHFPRTWVLASVMAALSLVALLPFERLGASPRVAVFAAALGAGVLVFGGANLANKGAGVAALAAGVVAWLAVAVIAGRREQTGAGVAGLFAGAAVTFAVVAFCVVAVSGSA